MSGRWLDLAELSNVHLVELDVTVSQCREPVLYRTDAKLNVLMSTSLLNGHLASHKRLPATVKMSDFASKGSQTDCAGIGMVRPLLDVDMEWAKQVYDVNVWGPLAVTQAFVPPPPPSSSPRAQLPT